MTIRSRIRIAGAGKRRQYAAYAGLSVVVFSLASLARTVQPLLFQRFIGRFDPLLAVGVISMLGAASLSLLLERNGFAILRAAPGRGLRRAVGLATFFGLLIICVDAALVHPADMNVLFPQSLLFYPVIALMAEVLFHLVPLVLLLTAMPGTAGDQQSETAVQAGLFLVALIEPSFQAWSALTGTPLVGAPAPYAPSVVVYDSLHILAINLCQLQLFRRYDFMAMYSFRLVYYVIWHIVWGHVRLGILF